MKRSKAIGSGKYWVCLWSCVATVVTADPVSLPNTEGAQNQLTYQQGEDQSKQNLVLQNNQNQQITQVLNRQQIKEERKAREQERLQNLEILQLINTPGNREAIQNIPPYHLGGISQNMLSLNTPQVMDKIVNAFLKDPNMRAALEQMVREKLPQFVNENDRVQLNRALRSEEGKKALIENFLMDVVQKSLENKIPLLGVEVQKSPRSGEIGLLFEVRGLQPVVGLFFNPDGEFIRCVSMLRPINGPVLDPGFNLPIPPENVIQFPKRLSPQQAAECMQVLQLDSAPYSVVHIPASGGKGAESIYYNLVGEKVGIIREVPSMLRIYPAPAPKTVYIKIVDGQEVELSPVHLPFTTVITGQIPVLRPDPTFSLPSGMLMFKSQQDLDAFSEKYGHVYQIPQNFDFTKNVLIFNPGSIQDVQVENNVLSVTNERKSMGYEFASVRKEWVHTAYSLSKRPYSQPESGTVIPFTTVSQGNSSRLVNQSAPSTLIFRTQEELNQFNTQYGLSLSVPEGFDYSQSSLVFSHSTFYSGGWSMSATGVSVQDGILTVQLSSSNAHSGDFVTQAVMDLYVLLAVPTSIVTLDVQPAESASGEYRPRPIDGILTR